MKLTEVRGAVATRDSSRATHAWRGRPHLARPVFLARLAMFFPFVSRFSTHQALERLLRKLTTKTIIASLEDLQLSD